MRAMIRHALITVAAAATLALAAASPALASQPYPLNFKNFPLDAPGATLDGTVLNGGNLTLASTDLQPFSYTDPYANVAESVFGPADGSGDYLSGTWTSGVVTDLHFGFNELVSSWNAQTPPGTWIQVEVQPTIDDNNGGHLAKWYILGRWTYEDADTFGGVHDPLGGFHRTSVGHQGDADGYVAIDTFFAKDHPATAYRLRVTLFRRVTTTESPTLTRLSVIASNLTNQKMTFPSPSAIDHKIDLGVPQYSQETHHGQYPEFDNGGEAWCSPTSTSMVVDYWSGKTGVDYSPTPAETAWVGFDDPWVDYTARYVFDYHYNGAGNWPFNAAYAAARGYGTSRWLVADVTQLHSLQEAEPFIEDGIPLVASVAWNSNKLDTAIKSTNGHLLVIEGFTADGSKVIVNDPASIDNGAQVTHYYDREQFEKAWIPASGGIVYVIRPAGWTTPDLTANNSP
jgi:hypothetical protein